MNKTLNSNWKRKTNQKFLSTEQCEQIVKQNIEKIFNVFKVELNNWQGCCPIHQGDNPTAFKYYENTGMWTCFTYGCHEYFYESGVGLVRGLLSAPWKADQDKYDFQKTLEFIGEFGKGEDVGQIGNIRGTPTIDSFVKQMKLLELGQNQENGSFKIKEKTLRQKLIVPSPYFIKRGFDSELLNKYCVGDCWSKDKPFYGRAVIPIRSANYIIGATARSTYNSCSICKQYHPDNIDCGTNRWPKWKHASKFKKNWLWNFGEALPYIKESGTVILCEGPLDVLRLEQLGIHNSVAIFGCNLNEQQIKTLNGSGALSLVLAFDNDKPGRKCALNIEKKLFNLYNIVKMPWLHPNNNVVFKKDVGEMGKIELPIIMDTIEKAKI